MRLFWSVITKRVRAVESPFSRTSMAFSAKPVKWPYGSFLPLLPEFLLAAPPDGPRDLLTLFLL